MAETAKSYMFDVNQGKFFASIGEKDAEVAGRPEFFEFQCPRLGGRECGCTAWGCHVSCFEAARRAGVGTASAGLHPKEEAP